MTEAMIVEQLANYLKLQYPDVIYHFDLSGTNNPSPSSRAYFSRVNGRGFPDLFIYKPRGMYHGLAIELKKNGTRLAKINGDWTTPHIAEQAETLLQLNEQGYCARFATGFEKAKKEIDWYLKGASNG
jgi:hypothetical protein